MKAQQQPAVAILLATYNGARYIEAQIKSLAENTTPFTLHWLDDHSTDNTREVVRSAAAAAGVELREWHQPQHHGIPGTFFELMNCVDADIYLFCDQDDIWQPGKIDATVAHLMPKATSPALCFSDALMFYEDEPGIFYRVSTTPHIDVDTDNPATFLESRALLFTMATGQTVGFTRPLRELYLQHKDIARAYAYMHSWWMYILAVAAGEARFLRDVPTTLYRQHGSNVTTTYYARSQTLRSSIAAKWRVQHMFRGFAARQAKGFVLASATLPPGPKLDRLLAIAPLVTDIDRRQSLPALARLLHRRTMWPSLRKMLWMSAACLWSDATPAAVAAPLAQKRNATAVGSPA